MANTLTSLAPYAYSAARKIAQEPIGFLDAITLDFDNKGVAYGDTLYVPVAPAATVGAFTPAATSSSGTDKTAANVSVAITDTNKTTWHLTGEQQRSLKNSETKKDWVEQLLMQGMRAIRNDMESTAFTYAYKGSAFAVGTAGTTPFASSIDILADLRKGMRDRGTPFADVSLVLNTSAVANLQKLDLYQQANVSGEVEKRRSGGMPRYFGMQLMDSGQISAHTKGTATGYDLAAIEAVGQTTLGVNGSDSGTILAGDVIQFATDGNNYVVANTTQSASGAASGNIVINDPGVIAALAENDEGVTGDSYTPNLAFERNAIVGIVRPTLIPENPTIKQLVINDDFGMPYLLLEIAQYGQVTWELHAAYGFQVVNPQFVATLMG